MKFVIECTTGWWGVDETIIVEAETGLEAETIARVYWIERAQHGIDIAGEATEEDLEIFDQIN